MSEIVNFTLNGEPTQVHVSDLTSTLLDVLRGPLDLRGAKAGCEIGYCGACTVILNGRAVPACLQMIGLVAGHEIRTIEGLAGPDGMDPVQTAFAQCAGLQCGFCTPGHVMALRALLDEYPDPTHQQLDETVDGNYCRCTGYVKIKDSARTAVRLNRASAPTHTPGVGR
jgi:aerobic-type carbon monoxide dehydrogenase small subunit (CoxS/CutS family)